MTKVPIDSGSDVEQAEAEAMGVTLLPIQIRFGREEFLDGVNLSHREFFEKLIESNELPQTSQINEYRYEEALSRLTEDGSEVVVIRGENLSLIRRPFF